MPKRISSKSANHINPGLLRTQSSGNSQLDANTIEEMAKIFMQAQTNMINNPNSQANNSQEVLVLLQQINDKLESLQGSIDANDNTLNSSQKNTQESEQNQTAEQTQQQQNNQASTGTANEAAVSQELRKLFSTLLTNDKQVNSVANGRKVQSTNNQNFRQQQGQRTMQNNNSSIAVQTAAQVLSQAQYELSNELEASLQSLKQVISESEKIANKISSLLGEESDQKQ